ncbi:peptidase inhibitor family I36 protein [Streptomyces sp. NBC_01255]|uniref:peptidase inhibitor family I36 protein n=1 Tax=Streptomyces sp. NBC_01255 TaxID=2903798 RepID=UPI002E377455|nr:peptidase inhibitor family I36 protein [Streptomyces sp. NBC_01255]
MATTLGLTAAGLLGAGISPAQAATSDCPSGYFCAWKTGNATGTMYVSPSSVNSTTIGTPTVSSATTRDSSGSSPGTVMASSSEPEAGTPSTPSCARATSAGTAWRT